ncbi:MAG: phospholipase D family protein [Campylobacterota bacterium]|nr:phospholipase D family protein [Campylobacterota bacterium]
MKRVNVLSILIAALFLAGCNSIPKDYPRILSTAYNNQKSTSMGKMIEREAAKHPGKSGFEIIRYGRQAFTARVAMTEMAEKTLDLQYYLWEPDATGQILAYSVLKAADRDVKVRVLLDDIGLGGRDDMIAALDVHPNIEIRIFNPFSNRGMHAFDFLSDFDRVNHRMHNKMMTIDNALSIVGGRNIGDHYFGVSQDGNFRDLDMAAAGPVVREISNVYDYFWNGKWAVPIAALAEKPHNKADLQRARQVLAQRVAQADYPYPLAKDSREMRSRMKKLLRHFVWAEGQIVWDDPKQMKLSKEKQKGTMVQKLNKRVKSLKKSLYIESPYFIPRNRGTAILVALQKRGMNVRILTNSLSSNDVLPAHAGYERYRKTLVQNGIKMYEMRPDVGHHKVINKRPFKGTTKSGLHAKTIVFDEKDVFVGSLNLDPRSDAINTEGGLYVKSPELARRVMAFMHEGVKLENAYRVVTDKKGHLVWVTRENGKQVTYTSDPKAGVWQQFQVGVIQALPVEDQL